MKKIFLLSISTLIITNLFSQVKGGSDKYNKLFDLMVMEKYEDCAYKANSMMDNDKYKSDPEPYLYASMAFYNFTKMTPEELDNTYKEPIKDALKYADKAMKKDKKNEIIPQNKLFFQNLRQATIEHSLNYLNQENYSKSAYFFDKCMKIVENDEVVQYGKGLTQTMSNNYQGEEDMKEGLEKIKAKAKDGHTYSTDDEKTISTLFIEYSKFLRPTDLDAAKKYMDMAQEVFPKNEEIKKHYSRLNDIEYIKEEAKKDEIKIQYKKHTSQEETEEEEDEDKE